MTVEDVWFLKITLVWLQALTDMNMLMKVWLEGDEVPKIENYHPQLQGFSDYLEQFQQRQSDKIESYARAPLLFLVKQDFERHVLGWNETSQIILLLGLSAPEQNFTEEDERIAKVIKRSSTGTADASSITSE